MTRFLLALLVMSRLAAAATHHVAPGGDDRGPGTSQEPWATLSHAAASVAAGDVVIVRAGSYAGFDLRTGGSPAAPTTFRAEGEVLITSDNPRTPDGINVENADWVVIEGFTVRGRSRAGLRAARGNHVTFRRNVADGNRRWGLFTAFENDMVIEDNQCSRSATEHGIYVSNSGDRPIIRRNRCFGNAAAGIHLNGDVSEGEDGIISGALIEANILFDNGARAGSSAINCDGLQDSIIRNNLIYDTHASGISLYRIDAAQGARRNRVVNNTVVVASDGRWALNIQNDSSGNQVWNNILLDLNPARGAIDLSAESREGFVSDRNLMTDRFGLARQTLTLEKWRAATGQDQRSAAATPGQLFVGTDDYHLRPRSRAVGAADPARAPATDLDGQPRDSAPDVGAYELTQP